MSVLDDILNGDFRLYELKDPETEEYRDQQRIVRQGLESLRAILDEDQEKLLDAEYSPLCLALFLFCLKELRLKII